MISRLRTLSVAARRALLPVMVLLIVNIVITQFTRPIGPFARDGTDDELRNTAHNFGGALIFQIILLLFLGAISALIETQADNPHGLAESVILGPALLAMYAAIATCAIMLAIRPSNFVALIYIGVAIVVLAWLCLVVAIARNFLSLRVGRVGVGQADLRRANF